VASPDLRFTASHRDIIGDDHIELTSVGVDIGSSTSHLVFSRIVLEREGERYAVVQRRILHQSDILLTPYLGPTDIDGPTLERFIERQYQAAGLSREDIDSGALILTGTALLRENSRTIADLFAEEAGKFVAVSAGDRLEASLAAHGSGAAAASLDGRTILNIDIGGGTTKLSLCRGGSVESVAAMDVGARLVALDGGGAVVRLEDAARRVAQDLGIDLQLGAQLSLPDQRRMAANLADQLFEVIRGEPLSPTAKAMLRTPNLAPAGELAGIMFSGGVSEFIYGHERESFGDMGQLLAAEVRGRAEALGVPILEPVAGIRATVIGASQHTVQVSGNTIFLSSDDIVPLRNVPVARPSLPLAEDEVEPAGVASAVKAALNRMDLHPPDRSVALAIEWQGSATWRRLDAIAHGIMEAEAAQIAAGHPLLLVCDSDVGGLLGLHLREELGFTGGLVSIDGVELREFDYIDVGSLIPSTGATPVVIKSLIFPHQ
jgi:ethanolamine utilization protein EutA